MATRPTLREVLDRASSFLESVGVEGYSVLYVFMGRMNWTKTDWLLQMGRQATAAESAQVEKDTRQLAQHIPPQYLLGWEEFCGHRFKVTEATLIPRPETEELVMRALTAFPDSEETNAVWRTISGKPPLVVDIGTGTGAIAISVKLARPQWQVRASDISPAALAIAKENAASLGADIAFCLGDTLAPFLTETNTEKIQLLLSNPPYISKSEWNLMDESVRTFEPKMALFADNNGLAIYQKLARQAPSILAEDGQIFLEIGFAQGEAVRGIFQAAFPHKSVEIIKDLAGQDRILHVF